MSDIRQWLEQLGFGKYADAFEREEVDLDALPHLTSEILKDIGVPAGPRAKLLAAIQALKQEDPAAKSDTIEPAAPTEAPATAREAERRQLTVMFCDLVGSTALAEALDPEDLRAIMQAYQKAAGSIIERYEGHVAQYLGDGLMTYFGWPQAHEDDAERAVRAALEITEAVKRVTAPEPLAVRIGIATGAVVVGETGAGDASVPKLAVGETPNLAARLQGLAHADDIVIAAATRRLVGGAFGLEDLGAHALKGIVEAVRGWRVVGVVATAGRFEAAHGAHLTPLIGRDEETALLLRRWRQAAGGEGQVVMLSGEPGIGKSRLIEAVIDASHGQEYTLLRYQCSPYHVNTPYYPVIERFERESGIARDDQSAQKLDKLESQLAHFGDRLGEVVPLIAALLSIPLAGRYPALELTPQEQRDRTTDLLLESVALRAKAMPVLLVLEDAQWADPSTLSVLARMIDGAESSPMLVLVSARPEFVPSWGDHPHASALTLNRLGRREGAMMVAAVVEEKTLPDEVLDQIVAKTDGVPLFVEELTKTVLESGVLIDRGDRFELDGPLPPLAIPSTLQDSLMARLDRLATVKEIAQVGATIGREFSHELLAAVAPLGGNELSEALARLVASELIFQRGQPPRAQYVFKNQLVRDVAYQSQLSSRRQQLHARIAAALVESFPESVEAEPEVLALHYTQAGLADQAIGAWLDAGRHASERIAYVEAVAHLEQGLALLSAGPEGEERDRRELELLIALGTPLVATRGIASAEVGVHYQRARRLSAASHEPAQVSASLWGLSSHYAFLGDLARGHETVKEFVAHADAHDQAARIVSYRTMGYFSWVLGKEVDARAHLEQALALYDIDEHRASAERYGQDPRVSSLALLSRVLWLLGYADQALACANDAIAHAELLSDPHSTTYALNYATVVLVDRGDVAPARETARRAIALSETHGFPSWLASSRVLLGEVTALTGAADEGLALAEQGFADFTALGAKLLVPQMCASMARICASAGAVETGLARIADGLAMSRQTGECCGDAELLRLRGELRLISKDSDRDSVEADFRGAIDCAEGQTSKALVLRAATSLARLWQGQSKAPDLLSPVYGWFTEGFDTADLKDAKALLDELK
ncbi:MAG: AAA family ATPase [Alphaproteobacteria bacterium]|nr:AAA family ATPase [Alphaproteobacteria bacterium]